MPICLFFLIILSIKLDKNFHWFILLSTCMHRDIQTHIYIYMHTHVYIYLVVIRLTNANLTSISMEISHILDTFWYFITYTIYTYICISLVYQKSVIIKKDNKSGAKSLKDSIWNETLSEWQANEMKSVKKIPLWYYNIDIYFSPIFPLNYNALLVRNWYAQVRSVWRA